MNNIIENSLFNDIQQYCNVNSLDVKEFINSLLRRSFVIERYGERPCISRKNSIFAEDKKNDSLSTIDLHEENHQDSTRESGQTLKVDDDCQIVKPSKRKLK